MDLDRANIETHHALKINIIIMIMYDLEFKYEVLPDNFEE